MEPLDLYCERVEPGPLGEPLNALSNAGFFIAAWALWRGARRRGAPGPVAWLLIGLVAAIGAGSTLFHVYADTRTHVLDTTPILLFQLCFLWCYCRRAMRLGAAASAFAVAAFLVVGLYARRFPDALNGSLAYAPALLVLLALGARHAVRAAPRRWDLAIAAGLLLVSLAFRTVDTALCDALPLGTHFLWHLFNAAVVFLCVRVQLEFPANFRIHSLPDRK
jgi:hypothetical protein